jgi:hypothetical protein
VRAILSARAVVKFAVRLSKSGVKVVRIIVAFHQQDADRRSLQRSQLASRLAIICKQLLREVLRRQLPECGFLHRSLGGYRP